MRSPEVVLRVTEADRTANEIRDLLQRALAEKFAPDGDMYCVWVRDNTATWVVYEVTGGTAPGLYQVDYAIDDTGIVTLQVPTEVEDQTKYVPIGKAGSATEAYTIDHVAGRIIESKGRDETGGRIFRVQIIDFGESRNGRVYPRSVMEAAAPLYEGAKAFDRHRTLEEMSSSTVAGIVGSYRGVSANPTGLEADLHLLPSATHTAEAFDASLAQQALKLPPLIGVSHDVSGTFKPVASGGRTVMEATAITRVNSVDVVADPSAGGRATRMVAGGSGGLDPLEGSMTLKELLELLRGADAEARTQLLTEHAKVLTDSGITAEQAIAAADTVETGGTATTTTTTAPAATATTPAAEPVGAAAGATESVATTFTKTSFLGRQLIAGAVAEAKIDGRAVESITKVLSDRFTEADVAGAIELYKNFAEGVEIAGLAPRGGVVVTEDSIDKAQKRLDATFERRWQEGFTSFRDMYEAFAPGERLPQHPSDMAHRIIRESWAPSRFAGRATEATIDSTTFGEALGDSVTRRLIAIYKDPGWQSWRKISTISPAKDFRTQRRDRIGGFGDLADVAESGTYQDISGPTDEEASYAISKRGGTKGITFETVTNDDIEALVRIPEELGRTARRTLHRFVWITNFSGNPTCTYDSVQLFHASHANTTAVALSNAGANSLRQKMRDQAGYGVASRPLGIIPKLLVVPNELEDLANQLCSGDKAVPATTPGATDVPNLHTGMEYLVIDDLTDADDWFLVADTNETPFLEIGFLGGREDPELFMQDDPRVGAVFSADEVTWKIRHIYGGTILEHRAAQRGTQ